MTTKQKFKSDAFAAIHASTAAVQKVGAIDQTTMRQFPDGHPNSPIRGHIKFLSP